MSFLPRVRTSSIPKHLVPQWDAFCIGFIKAYRALMHRIIKLHPNGTRDNTGIVVSVKVSKDGRGRRVAFVPQGSSYPWYLIINEEVAENGTIHFDVLSADAILPTEWAAIPDDSVARFGQRQAREEVELERNATMYLSAFRPYDEWRGVRDNVGSTDTGIWNCLLKFATSGDDNFDIEEEA